jgi:hypothetical protein
MQKQKNIEAFKLNQGTSNWSQIGFCAGLFKNSTVINRHHEMFLKTAFLAAAMIRHIYT